jgi:peptide deformylase
MALEIAQLGQPVLRHPACEVPVEHIASDDFRRLVSEMVATLRDAGGVGLAGPQVFASYRVFLALLPRGPEGDGLALEVFVNPRIVWSSAEQSAAWEGCLSFPELHVLVTRPRGVRIEYLDQSGQPHVLELAGFPARVIQHEYDHLDGILTIDRAASTRDIVKASEMEAVIRDRAGENLNHRDTESTEKTKAEEEK